MTNTKRMPEHLMTVPLQKTSSYRPDIDGLRSIAIVSVVLYHAGMSWLGGGFTGVDIFFVISGYLIGGHIHSELHKGQFSYWEFYKRRAKRILPAFLVVVSIVLIVAVFILLPSETRSLGMAAFASILSFSNVQFWRTTNYFNQTNNSNPLLMTWSLGVEEQFYLVIPLLMTLLVRIRRNLLFPVLIFVCVLSFAFSIREVATDPVFAFFMLPARAWELGAGVLLAIFQAEKPYVRPPRFLVELLGAAGIILMLTPMVVYSNATAFPGLAALPSVLGTVFILASPESWVNRHILSLAPLVFIGQISYSLYLWHWPFLSIPHILYGDKLPIKLTIAAVACAFLMATLSYYFVEQPLRRSTTAAVPLLLKYAALSGLILLVAGYAWVGNGFPKRPFGLAPAEPIPTRYDIEDNNCRFDDFSENAKGTVGCTADSATPGGPIVAVWGDSHAWALAPAIRSASLEKGYGFVAFLRHSCLPITGASVFNSKQPQDAQTCFQFDREVLDLIEANPRIHTVIIAGFWEFPMRRYIPGQGTDRWWLTKLPVTSHVIPSLSASSELLTQSLTAAIEDLRKSGKTVVVMGDVPNYDFNPLERTYSYRFPVRRVLLKWLGVKDPGNLGLATPSGLRESDAAAAAIDRSTHQIPGVEEVELRRELCQSASECYYSIDGHPLYSDHHHLSNFGARFALRDFKLP